MDWTANIAVHESASPSFLREQIIAALRESRVHPHLLYSGVRQAGLWIALHKEFSPAQQDPNCMAMYDLAFQNACAGVRGNVAHVVSLACGDGSKDLRCLRQIRAKDRVALYTPADLSLEMVLTAIRQAGSELRGLQATPLVCDLLNCSVIPAILKGFDPAGAERLLLFLGTIHNYWPPEILRALLYPLRSHDQLLIGANLAPEDGYDDALTGVLKQYENEPTRRWLLGALSELDLSPSDGELHFRLGGTKRAGLKRVEAVFRFRKKRSIRVFESEVEFSGEQELLVFYSHRFTTKHLDEFFRGAGLLLSEKWIGAGGFEGLFLCKRAQ